MSSIVIFTNYTVHHLGNSPEVVDKHVEEFNPEDIYVATSARKVAEICMDLTFCFVIAIVGAVTNILVIIVFAKQKFKDSVAVSMTAISIWDFIKSSGFALQRLTGPISLFDAVEAESWSNISMVVFTYYTCFATYVSIVLAAYVAVERCLCVSMPFKAKWLITRKSSFVICSVISFVVFGWFSVMFFVFDITWVHSHHYNKTIAIYVNTNFFHRYKQPVFLFYNLSGIILPFVCFLTIVASTCVIVYHLRKSSNFRAGSTQSQSQHSVKHSQNQMSTRDRQIVKMLLVIIGVYVVCLTPRIAHYMAKYFVYDFYFLRRLHNLFMIMAFVVYTFDLINASVNLFIFMAMSSAFRATFMEVLPFCNYLVDVADEDVPAEKPGQKARNT